jgi:hypothetical protein
MGVDHNAYIGPYLRVTETVEKKEVDLCAEHNRKDAPYCPECGRSKKDQIYTYDDNDAPNNWRVNYIKNGKKCEFYDYLTSTSVMSNPHIVKGKRTYIYLPNCYYEELEIPDIDSKEEVPFDDLDVQGITKKFCKLFKDEINYLEQWFEVEAKFGYVSWCS